MTVSWDRPLVRFPVWKTKRITADRLKRKSPNRPNVVLGVIGDKERPYNGYRDEYPVARQSPPHEEARRECQVEIRQPAQEPGLAAGGACHDRHRGGGERPDRQADGPPDGVRQDPHGAWAEGQGQGGRRDRRREPRQGRGRHEPLRHPGADRRGRRGGFPRRDGACGGCYRSLS